MTSPQPISVKKFVTIAAQAQMAWQEFKKDTSQMPAWFHGQFIAEKYPTGILVIPEE